MGLEDYTYEPNKFQGGHCEICVKWLSVDSLSGYPGKEGHLRWYCTDCLVLRMEELPPLDAIKERLDRLSEMVEKIDRLAETIKHIKMDINHVYSAKEHCDRMEKYKCNNIK